MTIATRVEGVLREHGAHYKLIPHRISGSTHESAEAAHVREDHIAKAVVIRDDEGYAMAVIPGDTWLDLEALDSETGRHFELDDESDLRTLFPDCTPGAVPPLGPVYQLETFMDEALSSLSTGEVESGDPAPRVRVNGDTFADLMRGVRHGHFGR